MLADAADAALVGSDERAAIRMAVPPMHPTMRPIPAVRLPVKRIDFFEAMKPSLDRRSERKRGAGGACPRGVFVTGGKCVISKGCVRPRRESVKGRTRKFRDPPPSSRPSPVGYRRAVVAVFFDWRAALTRCGVKGPSRNRTPTASKMALPIAAKSGTMPGSPEPDAGRSGRFVNHKSTSGNLANLMTVYGRQ